MGTGASAARWVRRRKLAMGLVLLGCLCLGLCGCTSLSEWLRNDFKVGPNYHPPELTVTKQWIDLADPKVRLGNPNLATWWEVFDDPQLNKLIHEASTENLTVKQVGLQILQSKIQRNIALSELLPQAQSVSGGYSHGVISRNNGVVPSGGPSFGTALAPTDVVSGLSIPTTPIAGSNVAIPAAGTTYTGTSPLLNPSIGGGGAGTGIPTGTSRYFDNQGFTGNLSWEFDLWGLFRRNLEAADASLDQTLQDNDSILVQLLANVATQYVTIRTLQKRLELARQNVLLQEPLVGKLEKQYKEGIATSKPAYFQLKSNLDGTRALIPPLLILLRQANNQLCNLLGIPIRDLLPELGDGLVADPKDPSKKQGRIPRSKDETVVLSIPGETLLHRPDVQAFERQLRVQSAQIGIAEAEMFPHVGINGSIGLAANSVNRLFNQQSFIGSVGPSLTWNILNYGRLLANVKVQSLVFQQYAIAYQQALLNANQDAENALVAYLQSLEQYKRLQASANDAVEVTKYYYTQLDAGYVPPALTSLAFYNQIFTAVNFQVTQQDAAATAEGNIALNLILLYRALGGGWQIGNKNGVACQGPPPVPPPPPLPTAPAPDFLPQPRSLPQPSAVAPLAKLGYPLVQ